MQLIEGFGLGGAEKKVCELIANMDAGRFNTVVCSFGICEEIRDFFTDLDVKVITLPRYHQFDISLIWRLRQAIRREKIDIVMSTLFHADFWGALVGKWAGARAVFSWETISSPEWLIPRRLYPYRTVIRLTDKVISVSDATARWLEEKRGVPRNHITVIPYGVDLSVYKNGREPGLRAELGLQKDHMVVGMVGRLVHQKGHRYLVRAAEGIVKKFPGVRFVLVGDGPLRREIESFIAEKGLQDHFLLLGIRHDVHRILREFDIFCLPSLFEGLPNVILEAMASGLPVVATHVDGTKEAVVPSDTGLLVPPKDPAELGKALTTLLSDPKKAGEMGKAGRRRVEAHFSLEAQVKSFEKLYQAYTFRNNSGPSKNAGGFWP